MTQYIEKLKKVSLFGNLDEKALSTLNELLICKSYEKDAVIVSQEEPGDSLFIIASGSVKVAVYGKEGREVILSILRTDDFFGEMSLIDGERRSADVIANESSKLLLIQRNAFLERLKQDPDIAINILIELCRRLRKADHSISNLTLLDVYGRVAHVLLDIAKKEGHKTIDGIYIPKRPTHQEIANMIGASRETVSRTLTDFDKRGIIQIIGKSIVLKKSDFFEDESFK